MSGTCRMIEFSSSMNAREASEMSGTSRDMTSYMPLDVADIIGHVRHISDVWNSFIDVLRDIIDDEPDIIDDWRDIIVASLACTRGSSSRAFDRRRPVRAWTMQRPDWRQRMRNAQSCDAHEEG